MNLAEKIARVIYYLGTNNLRDAEESALNDPQVRKEVEAYISKLRRAELLEGDIKPRGQKTRSDIFDDRFRFFDSVDNRTSEMLQRAELYVNSSNSRAVLEIKQWRTEQIRSASNIGEHEMLYQQGIDYSNTRELLANVRQTLSSYGFPCESVEEFGT